VGVRRSEGDGERTEEAGEWGMSRQRKRWGQGELV